MCVSAAFDLKMAHNLLHDVIVGTLYTVFIVFVYTLLKAVIHYDLSVLPISVMGFQKRFGAGQEGWWEV